MLFPRVGAPRIANGLSNTALRSRLPAVYFAHQATQGPRVQAVLILQIQPKRLQSTSQNGKSQPKPEQQLPQPSGKLFFRALRQSLSFRPLFGAFRGQSLRKLFQQSPEELVIAIVLLFGAACVCIYVGFAYFNYFQASQFTRFPPHIAKSLRRALYYSNYSPDHKLALKYYKIALQQCTEAGLDPFSDEVIGVRIQLAAWLEKIGSYKNSAEVLESLLKDCQNWVNVMEESVKDGKIDEAGYLKSSEADAPTLPGKDGTATPETETPDAPKPENFWAKRTRVLGKSVGISVKLGELYADDHVLQSDMAGERLVWAVETVLKELQRRAVQGVKEGEGRWMSPEEIGGALEALGNHYESKSQHYLAAPLYLQAITMSPPKSCHTAVLMNNLAISLAQQPVDSRLEQLNPPGSEQAPTRATLLASARQWAIQAQSTAQKVEGEDRTPECDEACAVALCNLGDISDMAGSPQEAKKWFEQSLALSKKIGFEPGIMQSADGLKRVTASKKR